MYRREVISLILILNISHCMPFLLFEEGAVGALDRQVAEGGLHCECLQRWPGVTRNIMVIWVKIFQTEVMVEIYSKSLVRAITHEIQLELQLKPIKVMKNGLCL